MGVRISPVDVGAGLAGRAVRAAEAASQRVRPVLEPALHLALRPPLLSERFQPGHWLDEVAQEGAQQRAGVLRTVARWSDLLVPALLREVLARAGLTELLLQYVDLDKVVAAVDLDTAATQLDVEAVVRRVDLDEVVSRVDVDAVVNRVDVDAVARRLDLDDVLDRMDLTSLVLQRVDLDALVQAVLDRVDLIGLANEVIDGVDLPGIIRESTGSMASDTVSGVRMQGINADEAVGRVADRLLRRRGRRSAGAPIAPRSTELGNVVPSQRNPGG